MKPIIGLSIVLWLAGCSSLPGMPGHISANESKFDGSTTLSMQPAFVYRDNDGLSGSDLSFALYWSSAFDSNKLVLRAEVDGYESFVPEKSLAFNIDGDLQHPTPINQVTSFYFDQSAFRSGVPATSSSKSYLVDESFINRILSAERTAVRATLSDGYVEGVFTDDTASSAYLAFQEFMERREQSQ